MTHNIIGALIIAATVGLMISGTLVSFFVGRAAAIRDEAGR